MKPFLKRPQGVLALSAAFVLACALAGTCLAQTRRQTCRHARQPPSRTTEAKRPRPRLWPKTPEQPLPLQSA